jgi:hypothetical protein
VPDATVCPLAKQGVVAMAGDGERRVVSRACEDVTFWKTRGVVSLGQSARRCLEVEWREGAGLLM